MKIAVLAAVAVLLASPVVAQTGGSSSDAGPDDSLSSPDRSQPDQPISKEPETDTDPSLPAQAGATAKAVVDTVFGGIGKILGGIGDALISVLG